MGNRKLKLSVFGEKVTDGLIVEIVILRAHLELQLSQLQENVLVDMEADQFTVGILGFLARRRGRGGEGSLFNLSFGGAGNSPLEGAAQGTATAEGGFPELVTPIASPKKQTKINLDAFLKH